MITEPASTPDQREILGLVREVAQGVFTSEKVRAASASATGYDDVAWKHLVSLGWAGLAVPQESGGEDLGTFVSCLVHRELGARLAPSPYLATAGLAAAALTSVAATDEGARLLAGIVSGQSTAALVLGHGSGWPTSDAPALVVASQADGGWVLDGEVPLVLDGSRADLLVVVARTGPTADAWGLFAVDGGADGLERTAAPTVDATRSHGDVRFEAAPARPLSEHPLDAGDLAALVDRAVVVLAAEMVGAASACLGLTLEYLRTRQQFGRPIGSFQALKHRCADAAVSLTTAQEAVFAAAEMVDAGDVEGLRVQAPLVLVQATGASLHTAEEAIQLHGGVGFTDEFDVGLYYKRAVVDAELVASVADADDRLRRLRREAGPR